MPTRVDPAHSRPRPRPRNKASKPAEPNPVLDAIGITALAKANKPDPQRNLLEPGMHAVKLAVIGTIDGKNWSRRVDGTLVIAPDSAPVAASATPWADLLHSAVCRMAAGDRRAWLSAIADGEIPATDCGEEKETQVLAEMEPALKSYRAKHPAAKRGTVGFTPAS